MSQPCKASTILDIYRILLRRLFHSAEPWNMIRFLAFAQPVFSATSLETAAAHRALRRWSLYRVVKKGTEQQVVLATAATYLIQEKALIRGSFRVACLPEISWSLSVFQVDQSLQTGLTPGMKLEVCVRSEPDGPYWVANIITTCGQLLLLRYEGYQDDRRADFWCDIMTADLHSLGWSRQHGKAMRAPEGEASNQS